jgi:outer membrane protein OmpA-like peptidoglycan-associated protein
MKVTKTKLIGVFLLGCALLPAQAPKNQDENAVRADAGLPPIFRVSVTERTAKAISYRNRSGSTTIDFRGTQLMPKSRGEAKVESKQGYMEIEVEFDGLQPANKQGAEYLTYVLWAITPEGRTANLGEILLNGTKSKLNVTTELQVFGLVVTAEPYYSVTRPSDLIVMENVVRTDTVGKIEQIDAKYELFQRGQYQRLSNPLALKADPKIPLELYEARNAVSIARSIGADKFATETFQKAEKTLAQAEAYQTRKSGKKPVTMTARAAVQTAEDARAIAVKRQEEDALAMERQQAAERTTLAENGRAAAQSETDRVRMEAEAARMRAQADTNRLMREKDAQAAAAQTEADRVKRENEARLTAAALDAERLKLQNQSLVATAKADADRAKLDADAKIAAAKTEADRLRMENEAQRAANQAELDRVAQLNAKLEAEKAELRSRLLREFSIILQTRDTARGLIVNMSDVLFDTAQATLRPVAREKLAKVAGIIAGHPGLRLDVEGHTDSVGTGEYNQHLSEQRSSVVRDYLAQQGMAAGSLTAKGLGEGQPVASNDTAGGRQQNRRVELVVSGEIIGTVIGTPIASR